MEITWTTEYLTDQATKLAAQAGETLTVKHFWAIADRDLEGPAPTTMEGLILRAKNYIKLDQTFGKAPDKTNPDIAAAIKRLEILGPHCPSMVKQAEFLRFMCQTNLLFLGREVFNRDFTFYTHAPLGNFFVQKNPKIPFHDQDADKDRLLMYPRGAFKSTMDIIDCAQWYTCFPDTRILILTATVDLAEEFIGELKNYFFVPRDAPLTNFQQLFPEWCLTPNSLGPEDKFYCPKRTQGDAKKKDPSAWAAGVLGTLPGKHCDLMKADDVVNDKNADTPALVHKVIRKIDFAESLVDPGGFKDLIGTPYAGNDLYATTAERGDVKMLITPARWLKPASQHKDERDCNESDYHLLFEFDKTGRSRLTHDFLNKKKRNDLGIYLSQYMMNAAGTRKVKFTTDLLSMRTIQLEQLPHQLVYYIFWDFATTANLTSDYSCGAVIGLDVENRAYVVEVYRDHYVDSDLARTVVESFQKYQPRMVSIENTGGAQWLESTIRRYATEQGITYIPLDFFKVDKTPNAKASRVGSLQPKLLGGQLFFLNTISCIDDLFKEFKDFGSALHDDIPDSISFYLRVLPTGVPEPGGPGGRERQQKLDQILKEKEFYDMIYGQGDYAPVVVQAPIVPETGTGDASGEDLYDPFGVPGLPGTRR